MPIFCDLFVGKIDLKPRSVKSPTTNDITMNIWVLFYFEVSKDEAKNRFQINIFRASYKPGEWYRLLGASGYFIIWVRNKEVFTHINSLYLIYITNCTETTHSDILCSIRVDKRPECAPTLS